VTFEFFDPDCINGSNVSSGWCSNLFEPNSGDEIVAAFRPGTICDPIPFVLVFSDEFDGNSLDLTKWKTPQEKSSGGLGVDQPNNVLVSDGRLKLFAQYEPGSYYYYNWTQNPPLQIGWFTFTTSRVESRYQFHEGYYEIRCSIPWDADACAGTFPAFWLYGQNGCDATEIDVFEYRGNERNRWLMTTHYNTPEGCGHRQCGKCYEGGNPDDLREYGLAWDRQNITWWRDDVGVKRNLPRWRNLYTLAPEDCSSSEGYYQLNRSFPRAKPLTNHALNIIANVAVDDRDDVVRDPSAYPAVMTVDYIRYYRRVPCLGNAAIQSADEVLSTIGEYNFITGTEVNLAAGFNLLPGEQLEIVARDYLLLQPGVEISPQAEFIGRIGASNCGSPEASGMALQEFEDPNDVNNLVSQFGNKADYLDASHTPKSETTRPQSLKADVIDGSICITWSAEQRGIPLRLEIFSSTGAIVIATFVTPLQSRMVLPSDHLVPGVYITRLVDSQNQETVKFVIK